jgi:putative peptidoglycan lipid II flippase
VAAIAAAFAGWATVAGAEHLAVDAPGGVRSLLQGVLGGLAVLVAYVLVAFAVDAPDARRLGALLRRRRS